ncbi:MAG: hypothetical protein ABIR39_21635, partial [Nocardioides sp.]
MTLNEATPADHEVTLADRCAHWASVDPQAPCLSSGETTRTRAEVMDRGRRLAAGLRSSGRGPGSRIVYVGRNSAA